MASIIRMVCFANSRRPGGHCVAGREFTDNVVGNWIRPISGRENEGVSEHERCYADGSEPALLDLIDISVNAACPHGHQTENWVLDPTKRWVKVGTVPWDDLGRFSSPGGALWIGGFQTFNGSNDRIPADRAERLPGSLMLVRTRQLRLRVFVPGMHFGDNTRKVQACFTREGIYYALLVTDPQIEREYLGKPDGEYQFGDSFMTISLGAEHTDGFCYKLGAGIMAGGGRAMA